jgi:hypothetical protein
MLVAAHDAGRLQFFGDHVGLADRAAFNAYIAPLRDIDWVVYATRTYPHSWLWISRRLCQMLTE